MAQNTTVAIPEKTWTQLTDADVTSATFANKSDYSIFIAGTTSASAPTDLDGSIKYYPNQGEPNTALSDLFPGIAAVRLYAYAPNGASVFISHA